MKSCPDCNRTFDDSMSFCLIDGAILSAPFDSRATQHQSPSRNTAPGATEILYPVARPAEPTRPLQSDKAAPSLPSTMASPAEIPEPQTTKATARAPESSTNKAVASQSAMKTMMAPPPELMVGHHRQAAMPPTIQSSGTNSTGGKRVLAGAAIGLAVILIAGIVWFTRRSKTPAAVTTASQTQPPKQTESKPAPTGQSFTENINGTELKMVSVPGGRFLMGSPVAEAGRDNDEGPQNDVTVQSFYMSKYEVTQAQYKAVADTNPSNFKGDDLPVDSVSWNDAVEFCRKLSRITGHEYRLPTEAEWEYAARAGTSGPYAGNREAMTWYDSNSGGRTHPVGQKEPNGLGLYDMNGNLWEWCQSKYKPYPYQANDGRENVQDTDVRVLRGGSWESAAKGCRSAYRRRVTPDPRTAGFRIILAVG
jgi:formylglycine-generating enzyme required for sulfatase activity